MALHVHLITRRPCPFLVPLADGVKRNIEGIATPSVAKRSDSAPASSPDSDTSTGAIAAGGQFGSGQDHITGIVDRMGQQADLADADQTTYVEKSKASGLIRPVARSLPLSLPWRQIIALDDGNRAR
jgi:hypothetical protein